MLTNSNQINNVEVRYRAYIAKGNKAAILYEKLDVSLYGHNFRITSLNRRLSEVLLSVY